MSLSTCNTEAYVGASYIQTLDSESSAEKVLLGFPVSARVKDENH